MKDGLGYKYLLKNMGLLTLSQFATKILMFFLVPLYTSILTTEEYGTYDLFTTTIGILLPIITLNIQEAVVRFSLDKDYDRNAIVSVSFRYLVISNFIVIIGLIINALLGLSLAIQEYAVLFFLMFFVQSLNGVLTAFIRGIDKVSDLAISSVITSVVTIFCNIVFLVVFKLGIKGYFIANIVGPLIQCLYIIVRSGYTRYIKMSCYSSESREMISYSRPLIANSIAWWINSFSDRYVVIFFCGLAENGIYSVAGKIPSILNIFQGVFNQAWSLSAVKDFDAEDRSGFFSDTYRIYNCLMVVLCSAVIVFNKLLARILYSKDFYLAWKYVPWLTIAIVFGALSGYFGGFFTAKKDSKAYSTSTMIGAIANIILNLVFTPVYGPIGAAVATTISYVIVWGYRFWQSTRYIRLRIKIKRDIVAYAILISQACGYHLLETGALYIFEIVLFVFICCIYACDIYGFIRKILEKFIGNNI